MSGRVLRGANTEFIRSSSMRALAILALVALASAAHAQSEIMVKKPFAPPSANPMMGAAYMHIHVTKPCTLIGAVSDVAETIEIHTTTEKDGVYSMRKLEQMDITPDNHGHMVPGGNHMMLIGLHKPLKDGDSFDMELQFEQCDNVTVTVPVHPDKNGKAKQGQAHHHGH